MRTPAWWPIARWEFIKVLTRKDFYISLLLTPLLLLGTGVLAGLLGRAASSGSRVAVVWPAGVRDTLPSAPRVTWTYAAGAAAQRAALDAQLDARTLDAVAFVPPGFMHGEPVELLLRRDSQRLVNTIESSLRRVARAHRAQAMGIDTAAVTLLDDSVHVRAALHAKATGSSRAERLTALGLLAIFFVIHFATLAYMMTGVAAEKAHRVTEVIVSAVSAQTWIDGKLVAYVGLGALQAAAYVISAIACAAVWRFEIPPIGSPFFIFTAVTLTLLGLVFYSALTAAMMATLKDLQTTQSMNSTFMWLPFFSLVFIGPALDHPDLPWLTAVSMLPPFSPMLTPTRMALGGVSAWEAWATIAVMAAAAWWMRGVAGHAFRVAMLMYGKDVSLPELVRWAREK